MPVVYSPYVLLLAPTLVKEFHAGANGSISLIHAGLDKMANPLQLKFSECMLSINISNFIIFLREFVPECAMEMAILGSGSDLTLNMRLVIT